MEGHSLSEAGFGSLIRDVLSLHKHSLKDDRFLYSEQHVKYNYTAISKSLFIYLFHIF